MAKSSWLSIDENSKASRISLVKGTSSGYVEELAVDAIVWTVREGGETTVRTLK